MGMDMEMGMDPEQAEEDQHQPPEPKELGTRIQIQTELKVAAIANLKLFNGLCARENDVFGWQTTARHSPDAWTFKMYEKKTLFLLNILNHCKLLLYFFSLFISKQEHGTCGTYRSTICSLYLGFSALLFRR